MSKEVQEAIERINKIKSNTEKAIECGLTCGYDKAEWKTEWEKEVNAIETIVQDHERQNKVIQLMAEYIEEFMVFDASEHLKKICKGCHGNDKDCCQYCIQNYFEKKASE